MTEGGVTILHCEDRDISASKVATAAVIFGLLVGIFVFSRFCLGERIHFLRWRTPECKYAWEQAGMAYDSTLGYVGHDDFRCKTCHDYPAFDVDAQSLLALRVKPQIAMEYSVISRKYMAQRSGRDLEHLAIFKNRCRACGGVFSFLWHNSKFKEKVARSHYVEVLAK